jgi:hypothetical protein
MFLALFWLAATVQLVDEVFEIPAADWRYTDVVLRQQLARVRGSFEVRSGSTVRLWLVDRTDIDSFRKHRGFQPLAVTTGGSKGSFDVFVSHPGEYAIIVDNRNGLDAAAVLLKVELNFLPAGARTVRYAEPGRQIAIIGVSFAFFFAIVFYSARRLLRARQ